LRVDILPDLRHLAISNGDVEDPIVLELVIRGFDFSRRDADDQNPATFANSAYPRRVPASGQSSPGMIHSIFSAANAS
jgi:hypothetical protein